jgi:hypothetical protein
MSYSADASSVFSTRAPFWWIISLSIVATETSMLTFIGAPALVFAAFARPEQGGSRTAVVRGMADGG